MRPLIREHDRLSDMQGNEGQPNGQIDFVVDRGGEANRGRAGNFLKTFTDGLFETGCTDVVGGPERRNAWHDADDQQREEQFSLKPAASSWRPHQP